MAMMPKRVKYRKSQKGRVKGNATRGNYVAFGEYGLQTLEPGRVSAEVLEASRMVLSRAVRGSGGKLYIRVFPHKSITSIPAETRMGKGKGEVDYWAAIVKPGTVLFEVAGISESRARAAFARVAYKLPVNCRFVSRRPTL
ncbi:50S ribosomal protein L16 [Tautonia marina]|uniref:50S ribosomal protein L16 n=1 Tax=Tautonia marina TaxID=2653855 RepID=UPI001260D9D7|nr:50S ribosomal protein L16 [Tautonia marina]